MRKMLPCFGFTSEECVSHVWSKDENNQRLISQRTKISHVIGYASESLRRRLFAIWLMPNSRGLVFLLGEVESGGICREGKTGHPGPVLQV